MALLKVEHLSKSFRKKGRHVVALDDVSFSIEKGESLGVVGESGSGKSTLANVLTYFEKADSGKFLLNDRDITSVRGKRRKEVYRQIQMIFQNPQASFDPRYTLGESLLEGAVNFGVSKEQAQADLSVLLKQVALEEAYLRRYPAGVSGGECQRAAIARALMIRPSVLICDEITAALDVSVQAQILNLLHRLKRQQQLSYLFISHDIAVVSLLCEKLLVLYRGRVMEYGSTGQILENPLHPYSRMLVCAANRWEFVPSETAHVTGAEAEPWSGCPYRRRCRLEKTECGDLGALLLEREPGHFTACPYAAE